MRIIMVNMIKYNDIKQNENETSNNTDKDNNFDKIKTKIN